MVPFVYSGTSGRNCSELLRSPTELKRRTRSFSQHTLSNVPQTPPFFNVLPVHCAIPLLTDSPSVSTTHLGRVAMPANLPYYYSVDWGKFRSSQIVPQFPLFTWAGWQRIYISCNQKILGDL